MSNAIYGGSGLPPIGYGYPPPVGGTAPTGQTGQAYGGDAVGLSGAAGSPAGVGPIEAVVDQPSIAKRFRMALVNSTERLLKVGGDGGAVGRWFLGVLAGNLPFVTAPARKQEIQTQVFAWVGRADLMRTGMSAWDARLLQASGVANVNDLKLYGNPMDQQVLSMRIQAIAQSWGAPTWPSAMNISAWVAAAQGLESRIK